MDGARDTKTATKNNNKHLLKTSNQRKKSRKLGQRGKTTNKIYMNQEHLLTTKINNSISKNALNNL